jgi:hypothetical protein
VLAQLASLRQVRVSQLINDFGPPVASAEYLTPAT